MLTDVANGVRASPFFIFGHPGSGKSSVFANFVGTYRPPENTFIIPHFVGVTPDSTSVRNMIVRLAQEISYLFDFGPCRIPETHTELLALFRSIIEKVEADPKQRRLVLAIDALNQLDQSNQAHSLDWLPPISYPSKVAVILSSTTVSTPYTVMNRRNFAHCQITSLGRQGQAMLVNRALQQHGKSTAS